MTDKQKIIDALVSLVQNLIDHDLIKDKHGDHWLEIGEAFDLAKADYIQREDPRREPDTSYDIHCPVCHNDSTVHHRYWSLIVCIANDCEAHIQNPNPARGEGLTRVEQAELDAHNAVLSLARSKRILGEHKSPLD